MTETKLLSKKTVFTSKDFLVNTIEVQRSGNTFTKDVIERQGTVLILPLTENNEVYLVSEYRDAYEKRMLEVVAGGIEETESLLDNAIRELKEETGFRAKNWQHIATWNLSANMLCVVQVYVARELTAGETNMEADEDITLIKMSLPRALEKISKGEITVAHHIASLLLVDKLLREHTL